MLLLKSSIKKSDAQSFCHNAHLITPEFVEYYRRSLNLLNITVESADSLLLLFYSEQHSEKSREEFRIFDKYNFHDYLRAHDKLTRTSAAAATHSTHSVGSTDATSSPSPNHRQVRTFCFLHLTVSPSTILYAAAECVLEICVFLQYDRGGDYYERTENRQKRLGTAA